MCASDGGPKGRDAASEASGGTRLGAQHESAATPQAAGAKITTAPVAPATEADSSPSVVSPVVLLRDQATLPLGP